jgi:hypothetical protein
MVRNTWQQQALRTSTSEGARSRAGGRTVVAPTLIGVLHEMALCLRELPEQSA